MLLKWIFKVDRAEILWRLSFDDQYLAYLQQQHPILRQLAHLTTEELDGTVEVTPERMYMLLLLGTAGDGDVAAAKQRLLLRRPTKIARSSNFKRTVSS